MRICFLCSVLSSNYYTAVLFVSCLDYKFSWDSYMWTLKIMCHMMSGIDVTYCVDIDINLNNTINCLFIVDL